MKGCKICPIGSGTRFRVPFVLYILVTVAYLLASPVSGKKCPGKCQSNVTECKLSGGRVAGYCTNELACCDYNYKKIGSCGSNMSDLSTAFFQSPDYPSLTSGDLICQFDFDLKPEAAGVIIDFVEATMDGRGFTSNSPCESDMIFFKGFPDWTPPAQCGNMSNYAAVVDLTSKHTRGMTRLTVLAIMASDKYRWNIKISQVFSSTSEKLKFSTTPRPKPTRVPMPEEDSEEVDSTDDDNLESLENSANSFQDDQESELEEMSRILSILGRKNVPVMQTPMFSPEVGENDLEYGDPIEEALIVNGDDVKISTVPWQASLRTLVSPRIAKMLPQLDLKNCSIPEGIHFCGGSIISDRHILSATHCFLNGKKLNTWQKLTRMKVVLGDSNLCDSENEVTYFEDGYIQEFQVDKVLYHYGYDDNSILNDMVVIKIKGKIRFNENIRPIQMAVEGMNFENLDAAASGWGLTNLTTDEDKQKTPEQLQIAKDLHIGNMSWCSKEKMKMYTSTTQRRIKSYPKWSDLFSSTICTFVRNGTMPRVVGQGDSGGPLIIPKYKGNMTFDVTQGDPLLIGVISYMVPIAADDPHDVSKYVDFYQSVAFYRKWIDVAIQH